MSQRRAVGARTDNAAWRAAHARLNARRCASAQRRRARRCATTRSRARRRRGKAQFVIVAAGEQRTRARRGRDNGAASPRPAARPSSISAATPERSRYARDRRASRRKCRSRCGRRRAARAPARCAARGWCSFAAQRASSAGRAGCAARAPPAPAPHRRACPTPRCHRPARAPSRRKAGPRGTSPMICTQILSGPRVVSPPIRSTP